MYVYTGLCYRAPLRSLPCSCYRVGWWQLAPDKRNLFNILESYPFVTEAQKVKVVA